MHLFLPFLKFLLFQYLNLDVVPEMRENDQNLLKELQFWREIRQMIGMNAWNPIEKNFTRFFDKIAEDRL